jgi:hypothetical protein
MTSAVVVSVDARLATNVGLPNGSVRFTLTRTDPNGAVILPTLIDVPLDGSGLAAPSLLPNTTGTQGTQYGVQFFDASGNPVGEHMLATVPPNNCNLYQILNTGAPQTTGDALAASQVSQAAAAAALISQNAAGASASSAAGSASAAAGSASAAAGSASAAAGSASAAAASQAAVAYIYPAPYTVAPTARPDGSARVAGDIYFNSASSLNFRWNGSTWVSSDISTANLAASGGSFLVGHIAAEAGSVARTVAAVVREMPYSVANTGAVAASTAAAATDQTAAIQAAINTGRANIYLPDGYFGLKATSGAALTLSGSDVRFSGPGVLVPLANASGYAPNQMILVSGDRCVIEVKLWNSNDLTTQASDGSNEYPMDGVRVTGSGNKVQRCQVLNFVTGIVLRGGTGNEAFDNDVTVKQKSNLAWPNDGILAYQTTQARIVGNRVGMSTSASQKNVQFSGVSGSSTSVLRTGITIDASTESVEVGGNFVGEGFIAGVHSEGTGNRQNIIRDNIIYKQRRNGINAAGTKITVRGNWCLGTFNTDTTTNLTGIIGSVNGNTIISGNFLFCDQPTVNAVTVLANSTDISICDNYFDGTFQYGAAGVASDVIMSRNRLEGTCVTFASFDRPSSLTDGGYCQVTDNYANGCTSQFYKGTSGLISLVSRNKIYLVQGCTAADGVIEFGGSYSGVPSLASIRVNENECYYNGSTVLSGTFGFVKSSASSAASIRGYVRDNTFDTTIWSQALVGSFVDGTRFRVAGNSSNTGAAGPRTGTFTLAAANVTHVTNNAVSSSSSVLLTPTNAAAATLMQGTKSLYVTLVNATRFDVNTADGTSAAGTEQFLYAIVD